MTLPPRLTVVGELERPDHSLLPEGATCYFWGEYTPSKSWDYSPTNQLIGNLKKSMERAGRPEWRYKHEAIQRVGYAFSRMWRWQTLLEQHRVALIPIPPSKARTDPLFDPRMVQILRAIEQCLSTGLDIRDCLSFSGANMPSHLSADRPTPDQLYADLTFDPIAGRVQEQPSVILIFDDMLTSGAHYRAVTRRLAEHFPAAHMIGNFVARRRPQNPFADIINDFDDLGAQ
jgi:hypothetical protein